MWFRKGLHHIHYQHHHFSRNASYSYDAHILLLHALFSFQSFLKLKSIKFYTLFLEDFLFLFGEIENNL